MMRNAGRMKDRRVWLECFGPAAKGFAVVAVKEQVKKRELMRMRGQSSGPVMFEFGKNDPFAGVLVQHLSVEVTRF